MSCNCNTPKNKPLCQLLDLDVAYTGNAMEVNGVYIRSGDNLRIVLDAILKGDQDQPTEEITNFWFGMLAPTEDNPANLNDYYLQGDGSIWQYTQPTPTVAPSWVDTGVNIGGVTPTPPQWGEIEGDINAQTDLLEFIQENALSPDSIGSNLHLTDTNVLNAGIDLSEVLPGTPALALSESGTAFPFAAGEAGLTIAQGSIGITIKAEGDAGTFTIIDDQFQQSASFRKVETVLESDSISLRGGVSADSFLTQGSFSANGLKSTATSTEVLSNVNSTLVIGASGSGQGQISQPVETGRRRFVVSGTTANNQAYFEYAFGMPAGTTSQNILVTKAYVDALQTQITDLEARVAALETP